MYKVWVNEALNGSSKIMLDKLNAAGIEPILKLVDFKDRDAILEMANSVDAVVSAMERWDYDTLSGLKNKKTLIIRHGTGIDNIDLPAATELGVPIANCPGANAVSVAEIALSHILNCTRGLYYSMEGGKKGIFPCRLTGMEIDGKTIGLLGFGNIAKQLRRMLSGFDCKILAYDAFARPDEEKFNVTAADSMEQVFRESDIVSLHIPLNDETRGSVNMKYFDMMKPTAYLINTCRGAVINENDLVQALKEGKLAGAGLDVMATEPPSMDNPLFKMENVWISTHIAGDAYEAEDRTYMMLADTIIAYLLKGEVPFNILNKQVLGK